MVNDKLDLIYDELIKNYKMTTNDLEKYKRQSFSNAQSILKLSEEIERKDNAYQTLCNLLRTKEGEAQAFKNMYDDITKSTAWKITAPLRNTVDCVKRVCGVKKNESNYFDNIPMTLTNARNINSIGKSILEKQQNEFTIEDLKQQMKNFSFMPKISVIVPMYNAPMEWFPRVITCLQKQIYPNWELCLADDGSPIDSGKNYVFEVMKAENRIKFIALKSNGGISKASNAALKMATGEFVALLDQDDEITEDALFWIVKSINENPNVDYIYTDECKVDEDLEDKYFDFMFKPDWSPRLLINHMYTGHFSVYRMSIIQKVKGFRSEYDFSQDYDLILRVSELTNNIVHIERVLYFWRAISTSAAAGGKDFARVGNMHALKDWYNRQGYNVVMQMMQYGNYGRLVKKNLPLVSIIIPTDDENNLVSSIHGLMEKTSYSNIEIIPVTNSKLAEVIYREFTYLEDKLKICIYDKTYNFSDKCNEGAKSANGEVLLFYNDDVVPIEKDWIERMLEVLQLADVGTVSPLLTREDGRIQYAGMITGTPGLIGTAFNGYDVNECNSAFNHNLLREVTVLSGACFAVLKNVFEQVGGFDAVNTPNGHSDVDLSFKMIEAGYYNIYTPYARLCHIGNHSWHEKDKKDKADIYCLKKWGQYLSYDPYFTASMKKVYYTDFDYTYKICSPQKLSNNNLESKDILFVTHELSLTGAPIVLLDVVRMAIDNQYFPVVLSFKDGPLKEKYTEMGVTVIVDESVEKSPWILKRFAQNFDVVFANTIVAGPVVKMLKNSFPKVYWWLHEGDYAIEYFKELLPKTLAANVKVLFVSEYVEKALNRAGFNYVGKKMYYSVADVKKEKVEKKNNKINFLFIGSIELRKGADLLLEAIEKLPDDIREKCEFLFVGATNDEKIVNKIKKYSTIHKNVKIMGSVPHDQILKLYDQVDAVVIPSRDDPCPVVAIEAMAKEVPVICSNNTGTSYLIDDGINGFIVENEDIDEIVDKISYVVNNQSAMKLIGKKGRIVFEDNFKEEILKKNVASLLLEENIK